MRAVPRSIATGPDAPGNSGSKPPLLLRAYRGESVERVPVWFMRQAGRSLPEYRAIRERANLFEICRSPDLAAEVTLQPVRRLGVDAAILFSDITLPLAAAGIDLEIVRGVGPVIANPIRSAADLERLRPFDPAADAPYVAEAVRLAVAELDVPLIGFAGGPFTLASYLIEGGPSKTHMRTRRLMYSEPLLWQRLLAALADIAIASLRAQVAAGAQAVQIFESWAGALSPDSYREFVLPAAQRIFRGIADLDVPRIHFGVGTGELLPLMAAAGPPASFISDRFFRAVAVAQGGWSGATDGLSPIMAVLPGSLCAAVYLPVSVALAVSLAKLYLKRKWLILALVICFPLLAIAGDAKNWLSFWAQVLWMAVGIPVAYLALTRWFGHNAYAYAIAMASGYLLSSGLALAQASDPALRINGWGLIVLGLLPAVAALYIRLRHGYGGQSGQDTENAVMVPQDRSGFSETPVE